MAYYTGTINSATPAVAFMTAIDSQMISGGLTFVETYTSGTDVTNIYKSPAGSNSLGIDWFIFVNRPSTTGTVSYSISELYNSTTHLASKFAPNGLPTTANADYSVAGTCLPSSVASGASLNKTGGNAIPINTTITYYLNVTPERVLFGFSNPVAAINMSSVYVGIYEPMYDSIATLPTLCVTIFVGDSNTYYTYIGSHTAYASYQGATTRDYGVATTVSATTPNPGTAWLASCSAYSNSPTSQIGSTLSYPGAGFAAAYNSGTTFGTKRLTLSLQRGYTNDNFQNPQNYTCGILKDLISNSKGSGLSSIGGDTLSITNFAGAVLNYVKCGSVYTQSGLVWFPTQ